MFYDDNNDTDEKYNVSRFQNDFFQMIKTLTASQNPPDLKEHEHLKQQTTWPQLVLLINTSLLFRWCEQ